MKKKIIGVGLVMCLLATTSISAFAAKTGEQEIKISIEDLNNATQAPRQGRALFPTPRAAQSRTYTIPHQKGQITSNVWRTNIGRLSGNTLQWDYQVSAVYRGSRRVEYIRTTWQGSASLRHSGSVNLGISASGGSVGVGSSWRTANTVAKYWENNNGAKESSYRSNMVVTPSRDYRPGTIGLVNTAKVKLRSDGKTYQITSGV